MDARQSFKFAFISSCIDAGFTTPACIRDAVKQAMEKSANPLATFFGLDALSKGVGGVWDTAKELGTASLAGLAVAPPIAGAIAGHLAGKATDISDFDVNQAKQQELVAEYKRQADRLRREGQLRRYTQSGGSLL